MHVVLNVMLSKNLFKDHTCRAYVDDIVFLDDYSCAKCDSRLRVLGRLEQPLSSISQYRNNSMDVRNEPRTSTKLSTSLATFTPSSVNLCVASPTQL